jgi:hypothetical protein
MHPHLKFHTSNRAFDKCIPRRRPLIQAQLLRLVGFLFAGQYDFLDLLWPLLLVWLLLRPRLRCHLALDFRELLLEGLVATFERETEVSLTSPNSASDKGFSILFACPGPGALWCPRRGAPTGIASEIELLCTIIRNET